MILKIKHIDGRNIFFWIILFIPYLFIIFIYFYYEKKVKSIPETSVLLVDKRTMKLTVINFSGEIIREYNVSLGKNVGQKIEKGDFKTPEGIFKISSIDDSRNWSYDFEDDGLPTIIGAFGPYFLRLNCEFAGIGIHGTHDSTSIGIRGTHGCIRMMNSDLLDLMRYVKVGTNIIIIPSKDDI